MYLYHICIFFEPEPHMEDTAPHGMLKDRDAHISSVLSMDMDILILFHINMELFL